MRCFCLFTLILSLFVMSCKQKADIIFHNGIVHTVDKSMSQHQAVAVAGNRILAVGSDQDILASGSRNTRRIDLQGNSVYPGFIDSHYHFNGVGKREYTLNLDGCRSLEEFLERVRQHALKMKEDQWVIGRGWMEEDWPGKRFPNRYDLDKIIPDNPVILTRTDGHAVVVNSRALNIAGIDADSAAPDGGAIIRMPDSDEPSGLLLDNAIKLVRQHVPLPTGRSAVERFAREANSVALANGITQVHDMGAGLSTVAAWRDLYLKNELQVRIRSYVSGPGEHAQRLLNGEVDLNTEDYRLKVMGIKLFADGALGSRGAALLEDYSDAEGKGLFVHKDEEIYPTILAALEQNVQIATHAIGDAANRKILDLYEQALHESGKSKLPRFRIEHAQIVTSDDILRFARLGAIPSMQPSHAIGDLHFAVRRLGMARMSEGYPWRGFIDSGCFIPAGSDAPVEEGNPFIEFYAASVRRDTTGFAGPGWHREYRMSRMEALRSLTAWGAKSVFEEDILGSIEPGKLADLVVVNGNLMTVPESELLKLDVLMTMVDGKIVYEKQDLESE